MQNLDKQTKDDLEEFEAGVKKILSQDKRFVGSTVTVDYICKRTKKKLKRKIKIEEVNCFTN